MASDDPPPTITTMETKEDQSSSQPQCLLVSKNSIKSRSSNCLMDPAIGHWLPGMNLNTNNEWTNLGDSARPSRDDGGSSQSNSHFEHWKVASDMQRLKRGSTSRRKKRKKPKNSGNVEDGKEDDQLSPLGRKIIVFVAVFLFLLCILLVGVTLRLGPVIDEMGKLLVWFCGVGFG